MRPFALLLIILTDPLRPLQQARPLPSPPSYRPPLTSFLYHRSHWHPHTFRAAVRFRVFRFQQGRDPRLSSMMELTHVRWTPSSTASSCSQRSSLDYQRRPRPLSAARLEQALSARAYSMSLVPPSSRAPSSCANGGMLITFVPWSTGPPAQTQIYAIFMSSPVLYLDAPPLPAPAPTRAH